MAMSKRWKKYIDGYKQLNDTMKLNRKFKLLIKKVIPSPLGGAYHIGFCCKEHIKYGETSWYANVKWVDTSDFDSEGWFADPFFLHVNNDTIELLAEQWYYQIGHGRLVKMIINRNTMKLESIKVILQSKFHLSFPILINDEGKLYVYPENSEKGELIIYEYNYEKDELINPVTIMKKPLIDAQIVKIGNAFFLFAVEHVNGLWEETRCLGIYMANSLMGEYKLIQKIENPKNYERGAGWIIKGSKPNEIIRPSQDCQLRYGTNVILNQMFWNGTSFSESEIARILPNEKQKFGSVLHTYNEKDGLVVIDGYADYHPIMSRIYKKIRGIKQ